MTSGEVELIGDDQRREGADQRRRDGEGRTKMKMRRKQIRRRSRWRAESCDIGRERERERERSHGGTKAAERKMRNQLKDLIKTIVGEWYEGKITQLDHYDDHRDIDIALNRLHHDGSADEMRFMLDHQSIRFSKVEFCLITELKFGVIPDTARYDMVENGIHQRYFGGLDEVDYEQLRPVLRIGVFEQQYDAVKLCLLYMMNWILMGLDEREKIPVWQIYLVEDLDAFDAFP
ncbi:hypothetical protein Dsin_011571 [Dipteronia sinensis]|uniref:DUF1985 domain-containing protein n=1 Tax=Dipteronia sinensis TaxID=43782 RepID=A0AAE0AUH3_9ROSI|nr:hypothetical protein Dsin_011571 [Dipteronia sinensis]